jgi:hypothetical protein
MLTSIYRLPKGPPTLIPRSLRTTPVRLKQASFVAAITLPTLMKAPAPLKPISSSPTEEDGPLTEELSLACWISSITLQVPPATA